MMSWLILYLKSIYLNEKGNSIWVMNDDFFNHEWSFSLEIKLPKPFIVKEKVSSSHKSLYFHLLTQNCHQLLSYSHCTINTKLYIISQVTHNWKVEVKEEIISWAETHLHFVVINDADPNIFLDIGSIFRYVSIDVVLYCNRYMLHKLIIIYR